MNLKDALENFCIFTGNITHHSKNNIQNMKRFLVLANVFIASDDITDKNLDFLLKLKMIKQIEPEIHYAFSLTLKGLYYIKKLFPRIKLYK